MQRAYAHTRHNDRLMSRLPAALARAYCPGSRKSRSERTPAGGFAVRPPHCAAGPALCRGGSDVSLEQIERAFAFQAGSLAEKLVLLVLANHATPDGRRSWPSVPTIARLSGLDESNARRALRRLESDGAISATEPARWRLPTVYSLHLPPAQCTPGVAPSLPSPTPGAAHVTPGATPERAGAAPPNPSGSVSEPKSAGAHARESGAPRLEQNGTGVAPPTMTPDEALAKLRALRDQIRREPTPTGKRAHVNGGEPAPERASGETESISAVSRAISAEIAARRSGLGTQKGPSGST